jgi:hypothetical protein
MGLVLANCTGATALLLKRLAASKLCSLPLHERLEIMCFIHFRKQLAAASLGATPTLLQAAACVEQLEPHGEAAGKQAELKQARRTLSWIWNSTIAAAKQLW